MALGKKVTAFIGTQTKRNTWRAVQEFEKDLKQLGEIDFEYAVLSDYHLEMCKGCFQCFNKGEEFCPLKDDRDVLLEKIERSDGIVLATPSYAFQVTARMKNFLDRTSFVLHRQRYFNQACTALVTLGLFGGDDVVKYLTVSGQNLGCHASKGCWVRMLLPMNEAQEKQFTRKIKKTAERFYRELMRPAPSPSLMRLAVFRLTREKIKTLDQKYRDYHYYKDKGWFESDYYYPTRLGPVKRLVGGLAGFAGRKWAKQK